MWIVLSKDDNTFRQTKIPQQIYHRPPILCKLQLVQFIIGNTDSQNYH